MNYAHRAIIEERPNEKAPSRDSTVVIVVIIIIINAISLSEE